MRHLAWVVVLVAGLWPVAVRAQSPDLPSGTPAPAVSSPSELLGATLTEVPDVLYAHVLTLPKGKGLLIDAVGKNSVAEKIGLHRHDVIVNYGNKSVQDVKQLASLLWSTPPGTNNQFIVVRAGKTKLIPYVLKAADLPAASLIKPSGPPAVNLEVAPLENDRMKITFTYYAGGMSKLHSFTCEGTVDEIALQLNKQRATFPGQVQELLDVAVERIRMMKMR